MELNRSKMESITEYFGIHDKIILKNGTPLPSMDFLNSVCDHVNSNSLRFAEIREIPNHKFAVFADVLEQENGRNIIPKPL